MIGPVELVSERHEEVCSSPVGEVAVGVLDDPAERRQRFSDSIQWRGAAQALEHDMGGHHAMDWRDLIPRINLPTLIVSGRASAAATWKSQEWVHRQIKGSQFEVFEEAEGGQHFMFVENPEKFNRIIMEYLG